MNTWSHQYLGILSSSLLLTLLFYPLEKISPADRNQRIVARAANWLYLPMVVAWVMVLQQLFAPWNTYLIGLARGGLWLKIFPQRGRGVEVLLGVAFAVTWDIWQYWVHRWQHTVPALWETHKFHHSEVALNTSSQARHHPLSYVVYMVSYAPMLLLFGGVTPSVGVLVLMFRVWGFVNHANIRISFGPLTTFIAGPQWHRIHHSAKPEHLDKNFAAFFPFIDRFFGTYYEPARDEFAATGLVEEARQ